MRYIFFLLAFSFTLPLQAAPLQWVKVSPTETATDAFIVQDISLPKQLPRIQYNELINQVAKKHALDPLLVHAVVAAESAYNSEALSNKGAIGLMQVMPHTAARFGNYSLTKPRDNLEAGSAYLSYLLQEFNGRTDLALAGYNAGENAVRRYGNKIPPYTETQQYVKRVDAYYAQLQQKNLDTSPPPVLTASTEVKPEPSTGITLGNMNQLVDVFTSGGEKDTVSLQQEELK